MARRPIRIGVGAGFAGDRLDAGRDLVERANLDYLVFECLGERTVAQAQRDRLEHPERGYHPLLVERLRRVLPECQARRVAVVSNMGGANPRAAGERAKALARELQLPAVRIGLVLGDDVLDQVLDGDYVIEETGQTVRSLARVVSANAYLGAESIRAALAGGANVVLTGRVADPSLVLGPLEYEFGWAADDWPKLGAGTIAGHLVECATQVTGGYFADPGFTDVPDLSRVGYPIVEVDSDGSALVSKTPDSGGMVTIATCTAQLLYEVHDPARYLTPDVAADFTGVELEAAGRDLVRMTGGSGCGRPDLLKVSVGYLDGWIGEGQVSYGGPGALQRARLAGEIILDRLKSTRIKARDVRVECIGVDSLYGEGGWAMAEPAELREFRMRVAARTDEPEEAMRVAQEVDALALCGPAAGSIAALSTREVLAIGSTYIPRDAVHWRVELIGAGV